MLNNDFGSVSENIYEFNNTEMWDLSETFNMKVMTTGYIYIISPGIAIALH